MSFELQLKRVDNESTILKEGEIAVDVSTDEPKIYVGDETHAVSALNYVGKKLTNSTLKDSIIAGGRVNSATLDRCNLEGATVNNGVLMGGTILATMSDKLTNYNESKNVSSYTNSDNYTKQAYLSLEHVPDDASFILVGGTVCYSYIRDTYHNFIGFGVKSGAQWELYSLSSDDSLALSLRYAKYDDNILGMPANIPLVEIGSDISADQFISGTGFIVVLM